MGDNRLRVLTPGRESVQVAKVPVLCPQCLHVLVELLRSLRLRCVFFVRPRNVLEGDICQSPGLLRKHNMVGSQPVDDCGKISQGIDHPVEPLLHPLSPGWLWTNLLAWTGLARSLHQLHVVIVVCRSLLDGHLPLPFLLLPSSRRRLNCLTISGPAATHPTSSHTHFSFILTHSSHATRRGFPVASRVHSTPTQAQCTHALEIAVSRYQPVIDKGYSPSLHTAHRTGLRPCPLPHRLSGDLLHHLLPLHAVGLHPCCLRRPLRLTSSLLLLPLLLCLEPDSLLLSLAPVTLLGLHVHRVIVIVTHRPELRCCDSSPVLLGNRGSGLLGGRHDDSESRVVGQRVSRSQTYICFRFKVRQ